MVKPNSNEYEHGIESIGNAIIFLVLPYLLGIFCRKLSLLGTYITKYKLPEGHVIIASIIGEHLLMTQTPRDDNKKDNLSQGDVEIDPEVLNKLLSQILMGH